MRGRPPWLLERMLGRVLHVSDRSTVLGDLYEEFARIERVRGRGAAVRWYVRQSLGSVGPSFVRRFAGRNAKTRREHPAGRVGVAVDGLARDVAHGWRVLWRRPATTLAATMTLAIAIGANSATFGVIDAVLLRPLAYPGADRIVSLSETHPERMTEPGWVSIPNVEDWRAQSKSFESMAVFRAGSMAVTGGGDPVYVVGLRVGPGFFDVFGTQPLFGRAAADRSAGADASVVLSHGLWTRRFGSSRSVIGETLLLDGVARTIVAVMPAGYNAGGDWIGAPIDVWVPFDFAGLGDGRGNRSYNAIGRLHAGVALSDASTELSLIGSRLTAAFPDDDSGWTAGMTPWKEGIVGSTRHTLYLVWGAMALVLLVACANVGNLVLNGALAGEAEAGVRTALGARRSRLARSVLIESLLAGGVGAVLGLPFAVALIALARAFDPGDLPRLAAASVDLHTVVFTGIVAVGVGFLLGLYPAWRASRASARDALRSARSGGSRAGRRVRDAMAIIQLAGGVALLATSLLAVRGFLRLRAVPPGFDPADVLTAAVVLSWNRVPQLEDRVAFTRSVVDRLRALPGVESAAMINSLPFSGSSARQTFAVDGRPSPNGDEPFAGIRAISPDYAHAMRIPVRGREFRDSDLAGDPAVVLVNETLARRYFSASDPLGEHLILFGGDMHAEIVGVIGDVHHSALDAPPVPEVYVPFTADGLSSKTFLVRSTRDPVSLGSDVRDAIHSVDAAQPLRPAGADRTETVPLEALVRASMAGRRFRTLVLALLAGLAVSLSVVGLSAVVSVTVTERAREIGLRMALGAGRATVLRWIFARSARLAAIGLVAGLFVVLAGGSALQAFLFDVNARDPRTLLFTLAAFCLAAIPAILAPAFRATRIDPGRVLRQD
jgi:putative ABC transport system permease protein